MATLALIGLVFVFFFAPAAPGDQTNLYRYKLESLSRFSFVDTLSLQGRPSLWITFQDSCASCEAQLKVLSCLPKEVRTVALGIRGHRDELAKILRAVGFQGESLLASTEFIRNFQLVATPTLLITNSGGDLQKRLVGLTECENLKKYFETKTKQGEQE